MSLAFLRRLIRLFNRASRDRSTWISVWSLMVAEAASGCPPPPNALAISAASTVHPASGHQENAVLHLCQGEDHFKTLHFHEAVYQNGKIRHEFVGDHLADDNFRSIDDPRGGRLHEVIEQPEVFGGQFTGQHVRDDVVVGPLSGKPGGRIIVFTGGGRKGEAPRVFVNPQAHDGRFFRRDENAFFSNNVNH
jgi:hypothetical protein